jgi:hypothetical protein
MAKIRKINPLIDAATRCSLNSGLVGNDTLKWPHFREF